MSFAFHFQWAAKTAKHVLLIAQPCNIVRCLETTYLSYNFKHLTGVKSSIPANRFFSQCIKNKLTVNDFELADNDTSVLKADVICDLMRITTCAKMIGKYNETGFELMTDRLIGNIRGCMGFVNEGNQRFWKPNTILKADIRDRVERTFQVIAIYQKPIKEALYKTMKYEAQIMRDMMLELPKDIRRKMQINP